jgi:D-glycero-D-manno-heptose 1,7-bisphosphate phosphatase
MLITRRGGNKMSKSAVFFDRDGTLNIEKGFVHKREDFEFVDGAVDVIRRLREKGFLVVVVTNQSGIARGLYTEKDVKRLHNWINKELKKRGTFIDRFYFCPHHPEAPVRKYRRDCACRKPGPGMLLQAIEELKIDPHTSYMIGDKARDACAGKKAGITSILISGDEGAIGTTTCDEEPDAVVKSLREAAQYILGTL